MKMNRALILAVFALQLALCQVAVAEVEQTNADSEFATVHVRKNTGSASHHLEVRINGQQIGTLYGKQNFLTVQLTPGRHVFESWTSFGKGFPGLVAGFDIEVTARSEFVLECYGPQGWSGHPPKDAVLQRWRDYCPEGDLTESNGVSACVKPYHEHNQKKLRKRYSSQAVFLRNEPTGGCYLSHKTQSLDTSKRQAVDVKFVANAAFVFAKAERTNTIAAFEEFASSYPDDPLTEDANKQIEFLKEQEVLEARQQKIQAAMQRDARLPLTVRKDKYILSLTDHLNKENFGDAIFYFELLDQLKVELSPSFEYFWGESLLRTGEPEKALEKLYSYVSNVGSAGQYYTQALQLSTEAETELSQFVD
jgi:hypothetical protein